MIECTYPKFWRKKRLKKLHKKDVENYIRNDVRSDVVSYVGTDVTSEIGIGNDVISIVVSNEFFYIVFYVLNLASHFLEQRNQ